MILAIVGSRSFEDYDLLCKQVDKLGTEYSDINTIVSGGACGADTLAERYAREHHLELIVYPADWKKYGHRAGYLRNVDIVSKCDILIAFWDGKSNGTRHSLDLAEKQGKKIVVERFDAEAS